METIDLTFTNVNIGRHLTLIRGKVNIIFEKIYKESIFYQFFILFTSPVE